MLIVLLCAYYTLYIPKYARHMLFQSLFILSLHLVRLYMFTSRVFQWRAVNYCAV